MDKRTRRQRRQQELWVLLGQVTSAQHWHKGLLSHLKAQGFPVAYANQAHHMWQDAMKNLESFIRTDMELIKQNIPADKKVVKNEQGSSSSN